MVPVEFTALSVFLPSYLFRTVLCLPHARNPSRNYLHKDRLVSLVLSSNFVPILNSRYWPNIGASNVFHEHLKTYITFKVG